MPIFQSAVRADGTEIPSPDDMRARRLAAARRESRWVEYDRGDLRAVRLGGPGSSVRIPAAAVRDFIQPPIEEETS